MPLVTSLAGWVNELLLEETFMNRVLRLFDITGSRALVTGGGSGLGRAMALALRDAGAQVAIVGRSESILEGRSESLAPIRSDLSAPGAPEETIAECKRLFGGLDILVNAHAIVSRSKAEEFDLGDWRKTIEVNLVSIFGMCQAAGRTFLASGHGKIINLASMLSFSGGLNASAYAASKGGVAQLTKALANEWGARGVNVNAIAPGYFETTATAPLRVDPVRNRQILERLPSGRWGKPEDLDGAVIFLSSKASDYVHGLIFPVDGGWMAR
jgi:2-dehydro-3-deoxy-D-gluconate 5-dehydrogenase